MACYKCGSKSFKPVNKYLAICWACGYVKTIAQAILDATDQHFAEEKPEKGPQ